jgi:hypothetical protein
MSVLAMTGTGHLLNLNHICNDLIRHFLIGANESFEMFPNNA